MIQVKPKNQHESTDLVQFSKIQFGFRVKGVEPNLIWFGFPLEALMEKFVFTRKASANDHGNGTGKEKGKAK